MVDEVQDVRHEERQPVPFDVVPTRLEAVGERSRKCARNHENTKIQPLVFRGFVFPRLSFSVS